MFVEVRRQSFHPRLKFQVKKSAACNGRDLCDEVVCEINKVKEENPMRVKPGDLPNTVAFRISEKHLKQAEAIADQMEVSLSDVLRKLVAAGLTHIQEKQAA